MSGLVRRDGCSGFHWLNAVGSPVLLGNSGSKPRGLCPPPTPPSCRIHALPSAPIATAQGVLLNHPFLYAQELTPGGPAWRAGAGAPHQSAVPDLPAAPTGTARHSKHTHSIALCLLPVAEDVSSIPTTSEPPVPSTGEPRLLRAPTPTPSLHRVELSRVRRACHLAGWPTHASVSSTLGF